MSELIVMLTHNDLTVGNAEEVFDQCRNTKAKYWGFKEAPLPLENMKRLYRNMKDHGKKTALEVVAYTPEEGLAGAQMAAECGCDILMGTCYTKEILDFCAGHQIQYMPFVGTINGRPSVLSGSIESMIAEGQRYAEAGAFGIDLLGYRYIHNPDELIERLVKRLSAPVCVAGSIASYQQLDTIKAINPWAITIGSAFFENAFGNDMADQIDCVCDYLAK